MINLFNDIKTQIALWKKNREAVKFEQELTRRMEVELKDGTKLIGPPDPPPDRHGRMLIYLVNGKEQKMLMWTDGEYELRRVE